MSVGVQQRVRSGFCPWCDALIDAATKAAERPKEATPSAGDPTVCIYCAKLCVFTKEGILRRPTVSEYTDLMNDDQVARVIAVVKRHGPRAPGGRS